MYHDNFTINQIYYTYDGFVPIRLHINYGEKYRITKYINGRVALWYDAMEVKIDTRGDTKITINKSKLLKCPKFGDKIDTLPEEEDFTKMINDPEYIQFHKELLKMVSSRCKNFGK